MKLTRLLGVLLLCLSPLVAETGAELYQKAVTLERAAGNLQEAIKVYQRVAKEYASDRALAAKALVQAARCYEKLGEDGALKLYERVARDFADQPELAQSARTKVAALREPPPPPTLTMRKLDLAVSIRRIEGSDGQRTLYWETVGDPNTLLFGSTSTLWFGDLSGKQKRAVIQSTPDRQPMVLPSRDLSMALLRYRLGNGEPASFALVKTDGTGLRSLPALGDGVLSLEAASWSWDNRFILVRIRGQRTKRLTIADGSVIDVLDPASEVRRAYLSPDNRRIAYSETSGPGPVYLANIDGTRRSEVARDVVLIDWSRDGRYLILARRVGQSMGLTLQPMREGEPAGSRIDVRASLPVNVSGATSWANGALILPFTQQDQADRLVELAALDSRDHLGQWKRLKLIDFSRDSLSWSPDGQQIAYVARGVGSASSVRIHNVSTGADRELYRASGAIDACLWASTKPVLFCLQPNKGDSDIYSVPTEAGHAEIIGTLKGTRELKDVSSDDRILITSGRAAGFGYYRWEIGTANDVRDPVDGRPSRNGRWAWWTFTSPGSAPGDINVSVRPGSGGPETWRAVANLSPVGQPQAIGTTRPHFTNDENWIVYRARESVNLSGIYRAAMAGGPPQRLGDSPAHEVPFGDIVPSPDGRQFAVTFTVGAPTTNNEYWLVENFLPSTSLKSATRK